MKIQYKDQYTTIFESTIFRTTSIVIETSDAVFVVDPNWLPFEVEHIRQYVELCRKGRLIYLLFTHSDYDHIIAYNAFPDAITIASQAFVDNPAKEKCLQEIRDFDDQYYLQRPYEIDYPTVDVVVKEEGQQFKVGDTVLTFYSAAGHNADGIFTIIEPLGVWLAGDYLSNMEFPFIYHSSIEYEKTIRKVEHIVRNHAINLFVTGHGDFTTSVEEIKRRQEVSIDYIQQLRQAIKNGGNLDLTAHWSPIPFPKTMKYYHDGNVKLMQKEIT